MRVNRRPSAARHTWGKYGQSEAEAWRCSTLQSNSGSQCSTPPSATRVAKARRVIGRWLADRRRGVLVATKAGGVVDEGIPRIDLSRHNLSRQLPVSLERLGLSCIDLYMTHSPDDETPIAETLETLAAFIEQGLVGSVGACNVTDAQLRPRWTLPSAWGFRDTRSGFRTSTACWARADEQTVIPLCAERGLAYTPHMPALRRNPLGEVPTGAACRRTHVWLCAPSRTRST